MRTLHPSAPSPRPRKILHAVFSRRLAGAERYCADLANRQASQGDEVHVLGRAGAMVERILDPAVRFHALRLPQLLRGQQLARLASRLGIEVAHAHLSPACKALASAPAGVARIATLHVGYKAHQHARLDGLICVNSAQLGQLGDYGGLSRVVSNWLPQPLARAHTGTAPSLRAELGIAPDVFVVGAVGRLDASKGMDLLVAAFRATAPADAALVIIGEGKQRAELEKLRGSDPRIHLPGFRADVQSALAAFDLFVSPSREETFGLALLEAMMAGLPLMATATEGPREILRGRPGQLVTPNSMPALAAGLAREFAQRMARQESQRKVRVAYDLRPFDPAHSLQQIGDFYAQALGQPRPVTPLDEAAVPADAALA